jgi:hypothetical protein
MNHAGEQGPVTLYSNNERIVKCITNYIDSDPAVEWEQVEDTKMAIMKEEKDMQSVKMVKMISRMPGRINEPMLSVVGGSRSGGSTVAYMVNKHDERDE